MYAPCFRLLHTVGRRTSLVGHGCRDVGKAKMCAKEMCIRRAWCALSFSPLTSFPGAEKGGHHLLASGENDPGSLFQHVLTLYSAARPSVGCERLQCGKL